MKIRAAYLFPGQGAQYVGMGKDLYETYSEARSVFDRVNQIIGFDLKKICFEGPQEKLTQTRYAQPAIFVASMAALAVFESLKERPMFNPVAAAGLSLGEATALVAAGAMDFENGTRFVRDRGLFMDEASEEMPGTMAAILGLELDPVEDICRATGAEIGNLNAPGQIVISGPHEAVAKAMKAAQDAGAMRVVPLEVGGAFHSSCMDQASKKIALALEKVEIHTPKLMMFSNLTARDERDPARIKENLVQQMNHRTLWEKSMREILSQGVRDFLEIGPGRVLKGLMKRIDPHARVISLGTAEDFAQLGESLVSR